MKEQPKLATLDSKRRRMLSSKKIAWGNFAMDTFNVVTTQQQIEMIALFSQESTTTTLKCTIVRSRRQFELKIDVTEQDK